MKYLIKKQHDEVGDEYMQECEVEAEIRFVDHDLVLEVDGVMYIVPKEIFRGIEDD